MKSKTKTILIVCAIAVVYYISFFTLKFTILEDITLSPAHYEISENCIIVSGQAVTGPDIRVVEGEEFLLTAIPTPHDNVNTTEIEMTGKSIYDNLLDYPDYYACDWLIYGKVVGTTDRYIECGSGIIPVFSTEKVYPIMSVANFLTLETILFAKPPLGLLTAVVLYLWPVVVILILSLKKKSRKADCEYPL